MTTVVNIPVTAPHGAQPHTTSTNTSAHTSAYNQSTMTDDAAPRVPERGGYRASSHSRSMSSVADSSSPFVPLLLASLALLGWLGFQTWQLMNDRQALQAGYASQQQTVESSGKLRTSLDALAADTQRMADGGNPNAKLLVDELRKRGITINTAQANTALTPGASVAPPATR